jgi:hypothetical protein
MLFKGHDRQPLMKDLQDHGAQFNGSTGWGRTNCARRRGAGRRPQWALGLGPTAVNSKIAKVDLDSEGRPQQFGAARTTRSACSTSAVSTAFLWHAYGKWRWQPQRHRERRSLQAFYRRYQPDNAV